MPAGLAAKQLPSIRVNPSALARRRAIQSGAVHMRGASSGCSPGRRKTLSLYPARLVGIGENMLLSVAMVALKSRMMSLRVEWGP